MNKHHTGLDCLRCVLTIMVIVLHFNNTTMGGAFAYVNPDTAKGFTLFALEAISIGAVNGFLIMSGYLMCKSTRIRVNKVVYLFLSVTAYATLLYCISCSLGILEFSAKTLVKNAIIPSNYYLMLYCAIYLLSPYINRMLEMLDEKEFRNLVLVMLALFSLWPTLRTFVISLLGISMPGTSFISASGDGEGYTLINFCLCYLLGAYIRRRDRNMSILVKSVGFLSTALVIVIGQYLTPNMLDYCNIFVILNGIFLFYMFKDLNLPQIKIVSGFAKTSFSVFVIHTNFIMIHWFWGKFNISDICQRSYLHFLLGVFVAIISMYLICVGIDMLCRFLMKPIVKQLDKLSFMNLQIDLNKK